MMIRSLLALGFIFGFSFSVSAATLADKEALDGAKRFMNTLDQPGDLTYRQMVQLIRPFASGAFATEMENRFRPTLDKKMPPYELKDSGKIVDLKVGDKKSIEKLTIFKRDKDYFAQAGKTKFTFADMERFSDALKKYDEGAGKKAKNGGLELFIGEGIYLAVKSLSKSGMSVNHHLSLPESVKK